VGVASVPIPGTRRAARIDENLASLSVELSAEQVIALGEAGDAVIGSRHPDMSSVRSSRD
jgi:aryl-alcohol dehydrogenase-like predicted oxidoreductase